LKTAKNFLLSKTIFSRQKQKIARQTSIFASQKQIFARQKQIFAKQKKYLLGSENKSNFHPSFELIIIKEAQSKIIKLFVFFK
jgi:hypothetical protein